MPDRLVVASWNVNSIRSRLALLERLVALRRPDVLLLQETRCPDANFPASALKRLGYPHIALNGLAGHHGVAIAANVPLGDIGAEVVGGVDQPRHVSAMVDLGGTAVRLHSLYVPSGGDEPDPATNPKFRDKLAFVEGLAEWGVAAAAEPALLAGDLNIAPLPEDVWSHRQLLSVVSHTPAETERLDRAQAAAGWVDVVRRDRPPPERL
jgi:exodeoxyribonuclease-3